MNFNNNFSELLLLANQDITFWNEEGKEFIVKPISTKDAFFNKDFLWLINFLETEVEDLQKNINSFEINSHYDFLNFVLTLGEKREQMKDLSSTIKNSLKIIIPDFNFLEKRMFIGKIFFSRNLFDQVTEVIFKMLQKEKIIIYETDDEATKKEKEVKMRVQKIKKNSKKTNKSTSFEDFIAAILYEFPQYKIEDLFELNIYNFYYLFKYVGKIANYEVSKIAAGNGLSKKHKYFIEK